MSEFYVSLHSNACSNIYPNNKTSDFRNKLSNPIHLSPGEWEVSLFDMTYLYGHVMIAKGEKLASVVTFQDKDVVKDAICTVDIRSLYELLDELEDVLHLKKTVMKSRILTLTFDPLKVAAVYFTEKVCAILGLEYEPIVIHPGIFDSWTVEAPLVAVDFKSDDNVKAVFGGPFDVEQLTRKYIIANSEEHGKDGFTVTGYAPVFENAGWTSLFVYCDVIRPQYVADVLANCLKVVPYKGSNGDICHHSFVQSQFVDVSVSTLEVIHITILTETGSKVSFDYSPVSLTLKFRQKQLR